MRSRGNNKGAGFQVVFLGSTKFHWKMLFLQTLLRVLVTTHCLSTLELLYYMTAILWLIILLASFNKTSVCDSWSCHYASNWSCALAT